jgi:hypothetical protein
VHGIARHRQPEWVDSDRDWASSSVGVRARVLVRPADPHRSHDGLTLSPPGNAVPKVTGDAAYELCLTGVAACLPGRPTAIELALATDTAYGTVSSAGTLTLTLTNTLVWAISWIGSDECVFSGGGVGPRPSAPPTQPLCDQVALVNATTGDFIFSASEAH